MTSKSPTRLTVTKDQVAEAARSVGLGPLQVDAVWDNLVSRATASTPFSAAQVAWYFGAVIILASMGLLIGIVGATYGTGALLAMSVVYTALFAYGGWAFASQRDLRVPGGLLYMVASIMPAVTVVAGAETFHLRLSGAAMQVLPFAAVALIGLAFTYGTRIAFVSLPALLAGWVAAVTGADWFFAVTGGPHFGWEVVSVAYGLAVLAASFLFDGKSDEDYSYWGYAIGAVAVFSGLTFLGKGEGAYVLYALGGIVSMLVSVLLARRVFAFAGAAAVLVWFGHMSIIMFADSVLYPLALTAIGVATIFGGVLYHRNSERIDAAILRLVPASLRDKLPRR